MLKDTPGRLRTGATRSNGKQVDEWTFLSPFHTKDAPKLSVTISIIKGSHDKIEFVARSTDLRAELTDTDIDRLRAKVEAELRFQHDLLTKVVWEDWLEIEVRGETRTKEKDISKTNLEISYRHIKRGVNSSTGEAYLINNNGIAVEFPPSKKAGVEDSLQTKFFGKGFPTRDVDTEYSYVKATVEVLTALDDLMVRTQLLKNKIADLLSQDVVTYSLLNSSQWPVLSSAQPKDE